MTKICKSCGKSVDDAANFCPYCKGSTFTKANEVVEANSSPVHTLFYRNYNGRYVLSRTKVASAIVFLVFVFLGLLSPEFWGMLILGLIFAGFTYVMGFAVRKIIGPPSQARIEHNDYGLGRDLINMFFFWQNKEGYYVPSKTKLISHVIFVVFFIFALTVATPAMAVPVSFFFALFFEAPAFLIGYGIHRLTNPNPQPKLEQKEKPKPKVEYKPQIKTTHNQVIPEYAEYTRQLDELNSKFIKREKSTRDLIAKRFEPPQLTYTRFITGVDKSSELFKKHRDSAYTMINLADEYSPRIASEIEAKIDILKEILDKMEGLSNELIVSDSITTKEDVDGLMGEMDNLIQSVREYE